MLIQVHLTREGTCEMHAQATERLRDKFSTNLRPFKYSTFGLKSSIRAHLSRYTNMRDL